MSPEDVLAAARGMTAEERHHLIETLTEEMARDEPERYQELFGESAWSDVPVDDSQMFAALQRLLDEEHKEAS